ncbi:class I SAM-dependent methyltransferase [Rhizobium sp. PP-CC-3G-465]|uniref:class I SAM-dependent methyltransferase n=1 Tax=Rhizobium sp. PP-CC-3G-465 TaxID=2135648 RepID=UPI00104B9A74|nr:methyltransferase family protein [Rhizobium sp. PP-CC-3G-465]
MSEKEFQYISNDPDYRHLHDRERFKAMYDEVGTVEANLEVKWREEWMFRFKPDPSSTILELGAHNGPNLIHYARLGHDITGVEISDTLKATFERFSLREPEIVRKRMRMLSGWIEEFQPKRKYDYVLLTEVLEHVADPLQIIQKAAECVSKTGTIYISSPSTLWGNNTHVRGVPPAELEAWLETAGLTAIYNIDDGGRTFCEAKLKRSVKKTFWQKVIEVFSR